MASEELYLNTEYSQATASAYLHRPDEKLRIGNCKTRMHILLDCHVRSKY